MGTWAHVIQFQGISVFLVICKYKSVSMNPGFHNEYRIAFMLSLFVLFRLKVLWIFLYATNVCYIYYVIVNEIFGAWVRKRS